MDTKEFTKKYYINRRNTNCYKWDNEKALNKLPMWIADADFKVNEKVIEKLKEKIDEGAFGYGFLPKDYLDEMIKWNQKVSNIKYKKEWILFSKGAIDGICQLINTFTKEKDAILICEPVYNPFKEVIKANKRKAIISNLINNNYHFEMNFKDIEKKIIKYNIKMMILCSPHNPVGRVWEKDELEILFSIAKKYKVLIISDEVHCELIMPNHKFIPSLAFEKYQDNIIAINAESKSFSLALFNHCHIIIPNDKLRKQLNIYQNVHHINNPNAYNGLSSYYAYKYGYEWLKAFNNVIYENYLYLKKHLAPYCEMPNLEGTYLVYADFSKSIKDGDAFDFLYNNADLFLNAGEIYGKGYEKWLRFNLATSLDNIKKACNKIKKAFK